MTIFAYKRLTRNLEIENTSFQMLNIWRFGLVRDPKTVAIISNTGLLNGYSLYSFGLLRENQQGVKLPLTSHPDKA